jgi:hypothetical protein
MKHIWHIVILIVMLFFIYACAGSNKTSNVNNDFPGEASDSLVAYLERTPCFGVCPAYAISIYRSGYTLYDGKRNAERTGLYYTWLPKEELVAMGEKAEAINFFSLADEYRNPHLTDFPTIYIEVRFRGKKKRVTHYEVNPPENLVVMENYIDSLFSAGRNRVMTRIMDKE